MRNLKSLGLTLLAILAIGAITSASASANFFHSPVEPTTLTVGKNETQKFLYETGGKIVECLTMGGAGVLGETTDQEFTFAPNYSKCEVNGIPFSQAQVSINGCEYFFTIDSFVNGGPTHLSCFGTNQVTITVKVFGVSLCTLHIGSQTPASKSHYANVGDGVEVQPTQTGIKGARQGSTECGSASSISGTYTGKAQIIGEDSKGVKVKFQVG
jgi:hypothetical protein